MGWTQLKIPDVSGCPEAQSLLTLYCLGAPVCLENRTSTVPARASCFAVPLEWEAVEAGNCSVLFPAVSGRPNPRMNQPQGTPLPSLCLALSQSCFIHPCFALKPNLSVVPITRDPATANLCGPLHVPCCSPPGFRSCFSLCWGLWTVIHH